MVPSSTAAGISHILVPVSLRRAMVAAATPCMLLVLGAALGLAPLAIGRPPAPRLTLTAPSGSGRSAGGLRPLAGDPASGSAPVVYAVGSEAEAAALQEYVTQALIRRELPSGARVVVAHPGEGAENVRESPQSSAEASGAADAQPLDSGGQKRRLGSTQTR